MSIFGCKVHSAVWVIVKVFLCLNSSKAQVVRTVNTISVVGNFCGQKTKDKTKTLEQTTLFYNHVSILQ